MTSRASRQSALRSAAPENGATWVERHALLTRFDALGGIKLVLVRAPAGYGKTALLRSAEHRLSVAGVGTAWRTLGAEDDGAEPLERCLAEALAEARAAAGASRRVVVFLDELDAIHDPPADETLRRMISRLDSDTTFVIATGRSAEIGVGGLRLRGELREILRDDLRFDRDEALALLGAFLPFGSEDRSFDRLLRVTEGWAAGLRLAVVASARGASVTAGTSCCLEVAEYLADAVLGRQTAEIRRFLLRTCIPAAFTAELCDALTGDGDGARMIDRLERAELFLVPVEGRPGWFRYHRLFARFLRAELERDGFERPAEIHRRAAVWLSRHGRSLEAVEHALAAGDGALAAELLEEGGMRAIHRGEAAAVLRCTRRLALEEHPRLAIATAWAHVLHREPDEARAALAFIERGRGKRGPGSADAIALEPFLAMAEDRFADMLDLAVERSRDAAEAGSFELGATCNVAALGLVAAGRFDDARRLTLQGKASHRRAGSAFGEAYSLAIYGIGAFVQGRPREALAVYRGVEDIPPAAEGHAHARAVVATLAADALYEIDEIDEAERVLGASQPLSNDFVWLDACGNPHLSRARIHAARGDVDLAIRALEDGDVESMVRRFQRMAVTLRWEAVRLLTRAGRLDEATARARHIEADAFREDPAFHHYASEAEARDLTSLRLAIRTGSARRALASLADLANAARRAGRGWRWLKATLLEAEALEAVGTHREALRSLRGAVSFAAARGFVRSIADEGPVLLPLLAELRSAHAASAGEPTGIPLTYIDRLVSCVRGTRGAAPTSELSARAPGEPLSPREHELLTLVDAGLSNRLIARRLCVSENTVKTHVRHIYGKFHVTSRTAALAVARRRGLLP